MSSGEQILTRHGMGQPHATLYQYTAPLTIFKQIGDKTQAGGCAA